MIGTAPRTIAELKKNMASAAIKDFLVIEPFLKLDSATINQQRKFIGNGKDNVTMILIKTK